MQIGNILYVCQRLCNSKDIVVASKLASWLSSFDTESRNNERIKNKCQHFGIYCHTMSSRQQNIYYVYVDSRALYVCVCLLARIYIWLCGIFFSSWRNLLFNGKGKIRCVYFNSYYRHTYHCIYTCVYIHISHCIHTHLCLRY